MAKSGLLFDQLTRSFDRRKFLGKSMAAGLGISGAAALATGFPALMRADDGPDADHPDSQGLGCGLQRQNPDNTSDDTASQIFTAALIAEDLATTFLYNGIVSLGPGLSAADQSGLKAALSEEIEHARLLRSQLQKTPAAGSDPVQQFYFPTGVFTTLAAFLPLAETLEGAFIAAYLAAVKEFAQMAADTKSQAAFQRDLDGKRLQSTDLEYYAEVAASIMGVECEHRALVRVIAGSTPPDNLCFEQTDGIRTVFHGDSSAVVALTPFLSASSGKTAYSFATALANAGSVEVACTGGPPAK